MIYTSLQEFYKNMNIIGDYAEFKNEKNACIIKKEQALVSLAKIELTDEELEKFEFNYGYKGNYAEEVVTRYVSKYEETGKEEDKTTIIEKSVNVSIVYIIKNPFISNVIEIFDNYKDAINLYDEINNKIIER